MLDGNEEKAMLRHPFFGVLAPPEESADHEHVRASSELMERSGEQVRPTQRRTFFGQALAGLAGVGAMLLLDRRAVAQDSFNPGGAAGGSFDRGFSGQSKGSFRGGLGGDAFGDPGPRYNSGGGGTVTTYAIGEEGSGGGGTVTTYAIGEEGSGGGATTRALGEEGGGRPGGGVTTYALGEEGSYRPPRYNYYRYPYRSYPPRYTTYALGEEGRW